MKNLQIERLNSLDRLTSTTQQQVKGGKVLQQHLPGVIGFMPEEDLWGGYANQKYDIKSTNQGIVFKDSEGNKVGTVI
jgi:hypothetical protein